jgi:catechol 2,3-dioxygenase-like lactoylglutathione lyase family enzyme
MMMRFHHAAISTPDLDRIKAFYMDVVGCEEAWDFGWQSGSAEADAMTGLKDSAARAVMLKLGDSFLEIFEFSSPTPRTAETARPVCDHGITHICLQVEDLHAEYARMKSAGMIFHSAPLTQDSGYVIYGRDPDGNVVELIEFTEVSATR